MAAQLIVHTSHVSVMLEIRTGQCQHLANNIGLTGIPLSDSTVSHESFMFGFHNNAESLEQSTVVENLSWLQRSDGFPVRLIDNARICTVQLLQQLNVGSFTGCKRAESCLQTPVGGHLDKLQVASTCFDLILDCVFQQFLEACRRSLRFPHNVVSDTTSQQPKMPRRPPQRAKTEDPANRSSLPDNVILELGDQLITTTQATRHHQEYGDACELERADKSRYGRHNGSTPVGKNENKPVPSAEQHTGGAQYAQVKASDCPPR